MSPEKSTPEAISSPSAAVDRGRSWPARVYFFAVLAIGILFLIIQKPVKLPVHYHATAFSLCGLLCALPCLWLRKLDSHGRSTQWVWTVAAASAGAIALCTLILSSKLQLNNRNIWILVGLQVFYVAMGFLVFQKKWFKIEIGKASAGHRAARGVVPEQSSEDNMYASAAYALFQIYVCLVLLASKDVPLLFMDVDLISCIWRSVVGTILMVSLTSYSLYCLLKSGDPLSKIVRNMNYPSNSPTPRNFPRIPTGAGS